MLSLQYYKNIFGNDPGKLDKMKHLIGEDFKRVELLFFEADKAKDIVKMKNQLHKIYPIVSNLKYEEFLSLINIYRTYDQYGSELPLLNAELKNHFARVYQFLKD